MGNQISLQLTSICQLRQFSPLGCLWLTVALAGGCCSSVPKQGATIRRNFNLPTEFASTPVAPTNPAQTSAVSRNCLYGAPATSTTQPGDLAPVFRAKYVLLHESEAKQPLYVCEHVTADDTKTPWFASDPPLKLDPAIGPPHQKATPQEYKDNCEFDAAQLAPPQDSGVDPQSRQESFYLSNCSPMNRPTHQGAWATLERAVRHWASAHGDAFVISGPLFFSPGFNDGQPLAVRTIGPLQVAVPTSFYKIVAYHAPNGAWRATAFVIPNQNPTTGMELSHYVRTVAWVESHAGIRFFPLIPAAERQHLEDTADFVTSLHGARADTAPQPDFQALAVGESASTYCFANSVDSIRFNNFGQIDLTVKRLP